MYSLGIFRHDFHAAPGTRLSLKSAGHGFLCGIRYRQKPGAVHPAAAPKNYNVTDMQLDKREYKKGGNIGAIFHIKMDQASSHSEVIQTLSEFEGLQFIEEIQ